MKLTDINNRKINRNGFTIVELLVVIVVIGILAAITIVSYTGISQKAIAVSLQSDLNNAATKIKLFKATNDIFPGSITDCPSPAPTNLCIASSSSNSFTYTANNESFSLYDTNNTTNYRITESEKIRQTSIVCPIGFIVVPGSPTYSKTSDFCVMKYEAKADDNGDGVGDTNHDTGFNGWSVYDYPISATRKITSSAAGYPITGSTQIVAISASSTANFVYGCPSGCHLISEAEWMTLAQNLLSVPSNWSGGAVGSGSVYIGHTDLDPVLLLAASPNDDAGYYGTNNTSGPQRRTLTLTNGEVIWDLSGNVHEWTSGQTTGGEPGVTGSGAATREFTAITNLGTLPINPLPSGTGIAGAGTWNATNGIGRITSNADESVLRGFLRSNDFSDGVNSGILSITMSLAPSYGWNDIVTGYRVAK